ncbi:MAG TPA: metallophosphoesterase [Acidimicrobiia bacterium]|nr:metallophosphoesterase [Acidimicrobiia bacterium]
MRILVVSDLHYALKQFDWVLRVAPEYDVVVIAGDLLDIRSAVEPDAQIAVVLEYLKRMATTTTVVACSGNHDLNARNDLDERTAAWLEDARIAGVFVDGSRIETADVLITVCPWWDGPRTRDRVDAALGSDAARRDDRMWIWVYHAPPDQSPTSWTGSRHYGDTDLNAWIDAHRPDLVLCGHVHESPFIEGGDWADRVGPAWVVNAGRQPGPVPCHIDIDTDARTAGWISAEGVRELEWAAQYSGSGSRSDPS